ncbi:OmpH family outer membrane protein [Sphingomonas histidinilytica]|jgi:Skp family chaperone for outer membrane proteins|uniref:Periplasmic chaperone for outer membrane proteins Skp n=1 Tax=Rhizorhabdus histidinilytica TaxID=439228 RepID=A0A1T5A8Y6_9SPHN|nr:OmpH family outer membrane protein [Rhizorhabdus histidinilytica]MBO9377330.1 OmpH family outer membrane protein [Rhizorhabdus histidinilytica]QEH78175.1 OmpH family outer membrane protein [Sphingomonas sp. C8-2]SKB31454.1 periplasmic chaperone for outer membrane proteins Skp [Rhizorhabdus histidinilytica]
MKSFLKTAASLAALALLPVAANAQAATTPAPAATANTGVAVVDLEGAVANSAAYRSAMTQIETTYKAQFTALQTRQTALQGELGPLRTEIENLQKNPATPKATLDAKIAAFQQKGQAAQAELQRLAAPIARPQAYVKEQIGAKVEQALKAAMTAKRVGVVIGPEAVVAVQGGSDLTPDVVTQLNALVPSVSITPPANWQPGQAEQAAAPAGR